MIDFCTLGTGGAIPLPDRGLASLDVRINGHCLLIDCGEGTQTAIRRLGWGFRCIDGIFLTHYHADHCGGLPGFLLSMAKTGRTDPLHIWGGPGLNRIITGLRVICPELPYPLALHEFGTEGAVFHCIGLTCTAFPLKHSVPCFGLRAEYKRRPVFDPQKAETLAIPRTLWKTLQRGEAVQLDGRTILPEEVLGEEKPGLSFLYATDTRPAEAIARHGRGTELMILEGMYDSEEKLPQAKKNGHMLYREAAALASEAGTKRLLLTHFSNCIESPADGLPAAHAIFPETACAEELMTFTLNFADKR